MKSYTDISQSKKLAEILPLESADMKYEYPSIEKDEIQEPMNGFHISSFNWFKESDSFIYFPCWSLAALLGVLPNGIVMNKDSQNGRYHFSSTHAGTYVTAYNSVDACYELILKLNELKML